MVSSLANQCQIAAATDLRRLPLRDSRSTWHLARKTTLIPSSPANRIVPRIFAGNLPDKGLITIGAGQLERKLSNTSEKLPKLTAFYPLRK